MNCNYEVGGDTMFGFVNMMREYDGEKSGEELEVIAKRVFEKFEQNDLMDIIKEQYSKDTAYNDDDEFDHRVIGNAVAEAIMEFEDEEISLEIAEDIMRIAMHKDIDETDGHALADWVLTQVILSYIKDSGNLIDMYFGVFKYYS